MKPVGPGYRIDYSGKNASLVFSPPCGDDHFFIRIFLKGPAMDQAAGSPVLSRELLIDAFPPNGPLVAPHQVHGTDVIAASSKTALPVRPPADGAHLDKGGIEASLRFADCFPVILASATPFPRITLLHSGYKGTVLNIAGKACRTFLGQEGADPSNTWAWTGPGIGKKHYFRKKAELWTQKGLEVFSPENTASDGNDVYFDLGGEIRKQIREAGIPDQMICSVPLCTYEDNDICYSYRKGDRENRLFLLAWLN